MTQKYKLAALLAFFLLCSCASYMKRKSCESTDWYQHGYDIAMKGTYVTGDNLVEECKKVDANINESQLDQGFKAGRDNYCKPEIAYQTGKKGDFLSAEMCDPNMKMILISKHTEGVKTYCSVENGYDAGASGKKYNQICPAEMEKKWMPEYKRGRKKYLSVKADETQIKINDVRSKVAELQRERSMAQSGLFSTPSPPPAISGQPYNDPYQTQRESYQSQVSSLNSQIASEEAKREKLQKEMLDYKSEAETLN